VLRLVQKGRGKVERGAHTIDDDSYACRCQSAWSGYAASAQAHQADNEGRRHSDLEHVHTAGADTHHSRRKAYAAARMARVTGLESTMGTKSFSG
jgi:hypothetical protein